MLGHIFPVDFIHCIYIIKKLHAHTSREFIFALIRHGSIARVITISGMQALCTVSSQRVLLVGAYFDKYWRSHD